MLIFPANSGTVLSQSTCYPAPRLTLTHLRPDLKSGLSAESDRIAEAIRNSFNADNQAISKIVIFRLFPHPQIVSECVVNE